jgi:hypothetical protein
MGAIMACCSHHGKSNNNDDDRRIYRKIGRTRERTNPVAEYIFLIGSY